MRNIRKVFALLISWFLLYGCATGQIPSGTQVYGIVSDNVNDTNQNCKFVRLDAASGNIIDNIFDFGNDGSYPDAAFSPDGRFIAYNKWIGKMDLEIFLYDMTEKSERQLTFDSNGENNRISWIDNETILAVFCSHKRGEDGWHIFTYHVPDGKTTFIKPVNSQNGEPVHFYGVKALSKSKQLLFVRGLESGYLRSWNDKGFANSLYLCSSDGTDETKLLDAMQERTLGAIAVNPNQDKVLVEAFRYPQTFDDDEASDIYLYDLQTNQCSLLEDGTSDTSIEHWSLGWANDNTIVYRTREHWYCINVETKEKQELFTQNLKMDGKYFILNMFIREE